MVKNADWQRFTAEVWNSADTGNVTIFKVVKNFSCWTVVVSIVLTVCKIAHKHSLSYYRFLSGIHVCPRRWFDLVVSLFYVFQRQNSLTGFEED